jgi:hypothetical protein
MPYYPTDPPISPSYTNPSPVPSAINSPNVAVFPKDARFAPHPLTPLYDSSTNPLNQPSSSATTLNSENAEKDEEMEEEDSDSCSWDPNSSSAAPNSVKSGHRRTHSANEISLRNAKRAHTVVV